jgi:predicted unusual protein kinase regulating ubiquinone biosynthesis (AarF/ABC1/UbiB family)
MFSFIKLLANAFRAFISYAALRLVTPREKKLDLAGRILTGTIIRLGPLYIKIGQILSTRAFAA